MNKILTLVAALMLAANSYAASCFAHTTTHGTVTSAPMNITGATILIATMSSDGSYNQVINDSVGTRDWETGQLYNQTVSNYIYNLIMYKVNPNISSSYTFSIPATAGVAWLSATVWACNGITLDHPMAQQTGIGYTGSISTTWQPGTVTPVEAGDLIFAAGSANATTGTTTASINSGFATPVVNNSAGYITHVSSWLSAPDTTPVNPTWTTNHTEWTGSIAVFKSSSAAPSPDVGQHITSPVGTGLYGFAGDGGPAVDAKTEYPGEVIKTSNGLICFADVNNNRIRCFNPTAGALTAPWLGSVVIAPGNIDTVAGSSNTPGYVYNVPPLSALMAHPVGLNIDVNDCMYIADQQNSRILRACPGTNLVVIAGGDNPGGGANPGCSTPGFSDPISAGFSGEGGPATLALLHCPTGVGVNFAGTHIVISDDSNFRFRVVNLTGSTATFYGVSICSGCIRTIVGNGTGTCTPRSTGILSSMYLTQGSAAFTSTGELILPIYGCNSVWKLTTGGIPSVIANTAFTQGFAGDGGPATSALLRYPFTVETNASDDIFITDTGNSVIRRIDHATGNISTIAGNFSLYPYDSTTTWHSGAYAGDGGPANLGGVGYPIGLYYDSSNNNLYIGDLLNSKIRMLYDVVPLPGGLFLTTGVKVSTGAKAQ